MFKIYLLNSANYPTEIYNDNNVYDPIAFEPELEMNGDNGILIGKLTFKLHELSYSPQLRLLQNTVIVTQMIAEVETVIFRGRPLLRDDDEYNDQDFTFEGILSGLNDTLQAPSNKRGLGFYEHFKTIIDWHNSQVQEYANNRQIDYSKISKTDPKSYMCTITETDPVGILWESMLEYTRSRASSMEHIKTQYVDAHGGCFYLENEPLVYDANGCIVLHNYLKYIDIYNPDQAHVNGQRIEFGKNLISIKRSASADDFATVLIPLGKQLTDLEKSWPYYQSTDNNKIRKIVGSPDDAAIENYNSTNAYINSETGRLVNGGGSAYAILNDVDVEYGDIFYLTTYLEGISTNTSIASYAVIDRVTGSQIFNIGPTVRNSNDSTGKLVLKDERIEIPTPEDDTIQLKLRMAYMISANDPNGGFVLKKFNKNYQEDNVTIMSADPITTGVVRKTGQFAVGRDVYPDATGTPTAPETYEESKRLVNQDLFDIFGPIEKSIELPDYGTDKIKDLVYWGSLNLERMGEDLEIEIQAADLSYIDESQEPFQPFDLVPVESSPHNLDMMLPIVKMTLPLADPAAATYTLQNDIHLSEDSKKYISQMVSSPGAGTQKNQTVIIYNGGGSSGGGGGGEVPVRELPDVTAADNGKVLGVVNGQWAVKEDETGDGSGGSDIDPLDIYQTAFTTKSNSTQRNITNGNNVQITGQVLADLLDENHGGCKLLEIDTSNNTEAAYEVDEVTSTSISFYRIADGKRHVITIPLNSNQGTYSVSDVVDIPEQDDELPSIDPQADEGASLVVVEGEWDKKKLSASDVDAGISTVTYSNGQLSITNTDGTSYTVAVSDLAVFEVIIERTSASSVTYSASYSQISQAISDGKIIKFEFNNQLTRQSYSTFDYAVKYSEGGFQGFEVKFLDDIDADSETVYIARFNYDNTYSLNEVTLNGGGGSSDPEKFFAYFGIDNNGYGCNITDRDGHDIQGYVIKNLIETTHGGCILVVTDRFDSNHKVVYDLDEYSVSNDQGVVFYRIANGNRETVTIPANSYQGTFASEPLASVSGAVVYNASQSLTDSQKRVARRNVGLNGYSIGLRHKLYSGSETAGSFYAILADGTVSSSPLTFSDIWNAYYSNDKCFIFAYDDNYDVYKLKHIGDSSIVLHRVDGSTEYLITMALMSGETPSTAMNTSANKSSVSIGGGSAPETFLISLSYNSSTDTWTCNKTAAEILANMANSMVYYQGYRYYVTSMFNTGGSSATIYYERQEVGSSDGIEEFKFNIQNNVVTIKRYTTPLNLFEIPIVYVTPANGDPYWDIDGTKIIAGAIYNNYKHCVLVTENKRIHIVKSFRSEDPQDKYVELIGVEPASNGSDLTIWKLIAEGNSSQHASITTYTFNSGSFGSNVFYYVDGTNIKGAADNVVKTGQQIYDETIALGLSPIIYEPDSAPIYATMEYHFYMWHSGGVVFRRLDGKSEILLSFTSTVFIKTNHGYNTPYTIMASWNSSSDQFVIRRKDSDGGYHNVGYSELDYYAEGLILNESIPVSKIVRSYNWISLDFNDIQTSSNVIEIINWHVEALANNDVTVTRTIKKFELTEYYTVTLNSDGTVNTKDANLIWPTISARMQYPNCADYLLVTWGSTLFTAKAIEKLTTSNGDIKFVADVEHDGIQRHIIFTLDSNNTLTTTLIETYSRVPVTVWEVQDVSQGLLARNTNISANLNWHLTGLNLAQFKRIKIYSRAGRKTGATAQDSSITPASIIEMSLDDRAMENVSQNMFIGSSVVQNPNDPNRLGILTCAVSADKTKFAVIRSTTLYGTAATSNTDAYTYVFKIEGCHD